jgi:hypothetical protein
VGGDTPIEEVPSDPPPPQPERNAKMMMIKIEKSAIGCLPDFANLSSSNNLGKGKRRTTQDLLIIPNLQESANHENFNYAIRITKW